MKHTKLFETMFNAIGDDAAENAAILHLGLTALFMHAILSRDPSNSASYPSMANCAAGAAAAVLVGQGLVKV